VLPGIALNPPHAGRGHAAVLGDLDFRLHRRVTEIRDGVMTLQPYLDRAMARWARGYCRTQGVAQEGMQPYVEALTLAAAIGARQRKERARRPLMEPLLPDTIDLDDDVRHLRAVAAAYRHVAPALAATMHGGSGGESPHLRGDRREDTTTATQRSRKILVARVLTELFAPAPVGIVALIVTAWRFSPTVADAVKWLGLSAFFVVAFPFAFLVGQVRRKRVTDIHVRRREQRLPIILVFLASWLVLTALLTTLRAPHELFALIIAGIATLVIAGLITLRWKISLHVGVASGVLTVFALLFGPQVMVLAVLVALLAWARTELGDHTLSQVLTGAVIGAVVGGSAFAVAMTVLQTFAR
jgi:membrane-associated phospholipid phosphatase